MTFQAPVRDIAFALYHIAGLNQILDRGLFEDLSDDLVDAILSEAGKFANEEIAPLNKVGDEQGARLENGVVHMPDGWAEAYRRWVEAGWGALPCPQDFGGQELPVMLAMACNELWNSASMAFGINSVLTQAAVHALHKFGSASLKETYLPKLVTGEWTGSMQLTEPQAGSDLSLMKTKAVPEGDGTYRLFGSKIFITYGEHPLTDNIIHMVLARTPDGPPGTKGISLFLVPKFLVNDDGTLGERNDVFCTKLEHKLGIHASPTCVMNYGDKDGANGWLVGEENKGLIAMFTMMNQARLAVGIQGVGIAERAYQQALAYAKERKQGRTKGAPDGGMVAIIAHPDVRRMLLSMRAKTAAARALCYMTANALDLAARGQDEEERAAEHAKASLLTPVAKAFSTDIGVEVASEGIQLHGGMGYIEETGAAQHLRDARIAPIYEGTNGIQAIHLVTRVLGDGDGSALRRHLSELKTIVADVQASNEPAFGNMGGKLDDAVSRLAEASNWMLDAVRDNFDGALAGATPYSRLFGLTTGGAYLAHGALIASRMDDSGHKDQINLARFFADHLLGETSGLADTVTDGAEAILSASAEMFAE